MADVLHVRFNTHDLQTIAADSQGVWVHSTHAQFSTKRLRSGCQNDVHVCCGFTTVAGVCRLITHHKLRLPSHQVDLLWFWCVTADRLLALEPRTRCH